MKSSVNEKPVVASMFESTTTISVSFNNETQPKLVVPQPGAKDNLVPVQVSLQIDLWKIARGQKLILLRAGLPAHQAREQEEDQFTSMAI